MVTITLSFKPRQVTKRLTAMLPERAREVLASRFGLSDDAEQKTLEAIGESYGITRERVRQIEHFALESIKKSPAYKEETPAFEELKEAIIKLGGVVAEDELLSHLGKDQSSQNHIHFFLVLHDDFVKHKEDDHFKHRWIVDKETSNRVHDSLRSLYEAMDDDALMSEEDVINAFLGELKDVAAHYKNEEILKRWLSLSKVIGKNPLGEWGKANSSNIRTRGIKDYAFLIFRRHKRPMHFKEVAEEIGKIFQKNAHVATTHNELIKDPRFVLVGRGLYALRDWGYSQGVVRDVIKEVLKKEGPLSKENIMKKVLEKRYVKENTIAVNLQNPKYFRKTKDGFYTVAK
ncbi:MAG: sigma factor-like helix-turn-helix DNA-binding protein [bacterium]|nr:sigma factor-like helix-turn-helix DNA-binding protein [bacterium]